MKPYKITLLALIVFFHLGCEKRLDEEVFSELSPSTLFTTETGLSTERSFFEFSRPKRRLASEMVGSMPPRP